MEYNQEIIFNFDVEHADYLELRISWWNEEIGGSWSLLSTNVLDPNTTEYHYTPNFSHFVDMKFVFPAISHNSSQR